MRPYLLRTQGPEPKYGVGEITRPIFNGMSTVASEDNFELVKHGLLKKGTYLYKDACKVMVCVRDERPNNSAPEDTAPSPGH